MPDNNCDIEILTKDDVLKVAQQFMKDKMTNVQDYSINPYSEHKLGHMGSYHQLMITIKKKNASKSETCKFFVKAVLQNSQTEIDYMKEHDIFTEEFLFFKNIKPLLVENYHGKPWSPACYLANKKFLVMEDLKIKGFTLRDNLFDKTSLLKSTLASLARFHACSIIAEARLTQLHKKPIFLNQYFPSSLKERFFPDDRSLNILVFNAMNLLYALAESLGRDVQKIRDLHKKLYQVVKPSKVYRNVICHSDLWVNNLMFNDTEPYPQCLFVDFQTIRYAPAVLDISQFLYLNTTPKYRRQHEQELIRFYTTTLEQTIKNNDETKTAVVPTFEEILNAYQDSKFFGASLAGLYFPFILLDQETIKEMYTDSDGFSKALFSDKTEKTFKYMKKNEFYKNRIEEVVNELADIADL